MSLLLLTLPAEFFEFKNPGLSCKNNDLIIEESDLMNLKHYAFVVITCILAQGYAGLAAADTNGKFIGKLLIEALDNGRDLKLIKKFSYRDPEGMVWSVPGGTVVNGASIPQAAWTVIGGPFSGKYRNASVIHDYYCLTKSRSWKAVHRAFYDAMSTSGVQGWRRNVMYAAVYQFGPRWEKGTRSVRTCQKKQDGKCVKWKKVETGKLIVSRQGFDKGQFKKMQSLLRKKALSREEIERLVDKNLRLMALEEIE